MLFQLLILYLKLFFNFNKCNYFIKSREEKYEKNPSDLSPNQFFSMKFSAIETEKTILKELGYEYYRLIENQPHKYLPSYIKLMKLKSRGFLLNPYKS